MQGLFEGRTALIDQGVDYVDVRIDILFESAELRHLVDVGCAEIVARWRCSATFATGHISLTTEDIGNELVRCSGNLDQEDLDGRVDIHLLMIATRTLPQYKLLTQHSDYGDASFSLERGAILADGGTVSIEARKKYDPMTPPLESCFKFVKKSGNRRYMEVDAADDDYIRVQLPSATFDLFRSQGMLPEVQISTVVLPALMEAIDAFKEKESTPTNGGWRGTIERLLDAKNLNDKSTLVAAQAILEDPISAGLKRLDMLSEESI
ncbi:hypothetical protein [Pedococcus soli]